MALIKNAGIICLCSLLLHVAMVVAGAGGVGADAASQAGAGAGAASPSGAGDSGGAGAGAAFSSGAAFSGGSGAGGAVAGAAGAGGGGGLLGGGKLFGGGGDGGLLGGGGMPGGPKEIIKAGMTFAINHLEDIIKKSPLLVQAQKDPRTASAYDVCMQVLDRSMRDFQRTLDRVNLFDFDFSDLDNRLFDLKVWLSSASKGQETCSDAFDKTSGDAGDKMKQLLRVSKDLSVTGFNMIDKLSVVLQGLQGKGLGGGLGKGMGARAGAEPGAAAGLGAAAGGGANTRKLLQIPMPPEEAPAWVKPNWKNLLAGDGADAKSKANAVVAADGSGKFKTIMDAVKQVPADNPDMFIIYVKAGVYKENVVISRNQPNVMVIGDGPTATKVTGSKSSKTGQNTLQSATFGVDGFHFLAKDMGFENTASPGDGPAVALRIAGDKSIVVNCQIDGYQDALFAQVYRQFYRDCAISGTIDFVFGGSVSIFQKCKVTARKPQEGQANMIVAHNREFPNDISGLVLDGCSFSPEPALASDKGTQTFLGRPWKPYARMIIMNSQIDGFINPAGWEQWTPSAPNTQNSFIAEYNNKGPGADTAQRVKWPSIKTISATEAGTFTTSTFLKGDSWIAPTGVAQT